MTYEQAIKIAVLKRRGLHFDRLERVLSAADARDSRNRLSELEVVIDIAERMMDDTNHQEKVATQEIKQ